MCLLRALKLSNEDQFFAIFSLDWVPQSTKETSLVLLDLL